MCLEDGTDDPSPLLTAENTAQSDLEHKLLLPDSATTEHSSRQDSPLIICFHGSGESCSPSWDALAHSLAAPPLCLRVLLFERGPSNPRPAQATAELADYLLREGLAGPYVLVAHSYGGAFARLFLEDEELGRQVVGVVLVETGQEGGLDAEVEEGQYRRRILGSRPLSVVRGNSLMRMREELAAAEANLSSGEGNGQKREGLRTRRQMLRVWDEADEALKKRQLDLAAEMGRKRYVHVPDCGHHVVRDRPDVVVAEVAWVLENIGAGDDDGVGQEVEGGEGHEDERGERERGRRRRVWEWFVRVFNRFGKIRR
ncbi:Alpha/beta hydrolase family-domain-containing protein [Hypoxylon crocopeplum]|nr:Alpha/beta hydrolase family-domain-containing protein [Hypoxylon crocopeplum]